jgi:hypothetical protein
MTAKEEEIQDDPEIGAQKGEGDENQREFPNVFYCPISNQLMKDPVVIPGGDSYERTAIETRGDVPSDKLYPNRALKSVIDENIELNGDSLRAGIKRLQNSVRQNISQLLDIPNAESSPLPESYFCPITFSLIHEPVIDPEGNTFERIAIENWIQTNGTSPITRASVSVGDLYPNLAVAELMEEEKGRSEESMHPSIKIWKEEPPPQRMDPPETGDVPPSNSVNTPATPAELEEARISEQRKTVSILVCFTLFIASLVLALLFGGVRIFIISLAVLGMCVQDSFGRFR